MAVGDQMHVAGAATTDFQPSSGVEVIIKSLVMGFRGSSNCCFANAKTSGTDFTYAIVGGSPYSNTAASTSGFDTNIPLYRGNYAHPVNNDYWLAVVESGTSHFHVAGYITKE
tara:strand:+ start:1363 stop:1701 length:339 start_codon:yes stop_codon:yes gene_type:complete